MDAILHRIKQRAFEALVLTFAVASVVEALAAQDVQHRAVVALLALGWTLPFALRPRYPLWAPLVALAMLAAFALISPERSISSLTMPFVAALAAAVSLGLVGDRRQSIAGWAAGIATAALEVGQRVLRFLLVGAHPYARVVLRLRARFAHRAGTRADEARRGRGTRTSDRRRARNRGGARTDRA